MATAYGGGGRFSSGWLWLPPLRASSSPAYLVSDVVAVVALFFGHLDGDKQAVGVPGGDGVAYRLLPDRVRKLELEDSRRLEISGVCEDFYR